MRIIVDDNGTETGSDQLKIDSAKICRIMQFGLNFVMVKRNLLISKHLYPNHCILRLINIWMNKNSRIFH